MEQQQNSNEVTPSMLWKQAEEYIKLNNQRLADILEETSHYKKSCNPPEHVQAIMDFLSSPAWKQNLAGIPVKVESPMFGDAAGVEPCTISIRLARLSFYCFDLKLADEMGMTLHKFRTEGDTKIMTAHGGPWTITMDGLVGQEYVSINITFLNREEYVVFNTVVHMLLFLSTQEFCIHDQDRRARLHAMRLDLVQDLADERDAKRISTIEQAMEDLDSSFPRSDMATESPDLYKRLYRAAVARQKQKEELPHSWEAWYAWVKGADDPDMMDILRSGSQDILAWEKWPLEQLLKLSAVNMSTTM